MDTPSPLATASLVFAAPGWVRVGVAAPGERIRKVTALELGTLIAEQLDHPMQVSLEGQVALPF